VNKIGSAGLALIQEFEQCRLVAYKPTPDDVWTCGWGSTQGVTEDTVWTQEEADAHFMADLEWVEECVNKHVTAQLSQNEYDACCSLCFNIGCGAFKGSTLVRLLNQGDDDGAAAQFGRWNKQAGRELAGLTRRRAAEANLFETA
jgi:lysozyme